MPSGPLGSCWQAWSGQRGLVSGDRQAGHDSQCLLACFMRVCTLPGVCEWIRGLSCEGQPTHPQTPLLKNRHCLLRPLHPPWRADVPGGLSCVLWDLDPTPGGSDRSAGGRPWVRPIHTPDKPDVRGGWPRSGQVKPLAPSCKAELGGLSSHFLASPRRVSGPGPHCCHLGLPLPSGNKRAVSGRPAWHSSCWHRNSHAHLNRLPFQGTLLCGRSWEATTALGEACVLVWRPRRL